MKLCKVHHLQAVISCPHLYDVWSRTHLLHITSTSYESKQSCHDPSCGTTIDSIQNYVDICPFLPTSISIRVVCNCFKTTLPVHIWLLYLKHGCVYFHFEQNRVGNRRHSTVTHTHTQTHSHRLTHSPLSHNQTQNRTLIHTHTHSQTFTYTSKLTHIHIRTFTHSHTHMHTQPFTHTHTHIH